LEIISFGQSSFKITGKDITVVIDPYSKPEDLGKKPIKTTADVVTVSHDHWDHNNTEDIAGNPVIFDMPGDYEVKGATFKGIDSKHGGDIDMSNTIFTMKIDDITIGHLGDLGDALTSVQLDKINGVDILLIPVGGNYTLDAEKAVEVVNQIEPKVIIPMHYKDAGSKADIEGVEKFIKEIGIEPDKTCKFKITKKDLPEESKVVILEP
jgi:L-ascorbate metabolism protein UlaG (beta-lactamase superfamily)